MRFAFACLVSIVAASGCHKAGNDGPDGAVLTGETHALTWGPVTVQAGQENTQCIWLRLPNATEIKVPRMHNVLSTASHHLIVYKDDMDTTEQTTPIDCQPFTGALNTTGMIAPMAITQKHEDLIALPDGVAYTFAPNQMIKLEMHYLNASDAPVDAMATVEFEVGDPALIHDEASIIFAGSPDITIPAGQSQELHQFFTVPPYLDLSTSHIFAITGHEHHYGTGVKVNVAPAEAGPMTPVYAPDQFLWSEPVTQAQNPDFSVPKNGGFDFTCTWTNTGATQVKFGESANDEMCFFWAYYWPSQGSKVCFHTAQYGGHDLCCPGDSLCSLASNF